MQKHEKNTDIAMNSTDLSILAPKLTREELESVMQAKACSCYDAKTSSMWGDEPV